MCRRRVPRATATAGVVGRAVGTSGIGEVEATHDVDLVARGGGSSA